MNSLTGLTPMHERRPMWLQQTIEKHAEYTIGSAFGFQYDGTGDDYEMFGPYGNKIAASSLLDSDRQLSILDIGAAHGAFVRRAQTMGHIAHALTLDDYSDKSPIAGGLQPGTYIVGDAERLNEVEGLRPNYDIVISSKTFWWLTDPLGTLEQAVDKVAPGGKLVIDTIPLGRGTLHVNDRLNGLLKPDHVMFELARAGFKHIMVCEDDPSQITNKDYTAIYAERRDGEFLDTAFNIDYEEVELLEGLWRYKPLES
jgi:SAM-dependent methyltransferase